MTDGLDTLIAELQSTAPVAPSALRTRIEGIAAREPAGRPTLLERIGPRRVVLIAAPTALTVMLGVALAHGLTTTDETNITAAKTTRHLLGERRRGVATKTPAAADSDSATHLEFANPQERGVLAPVTPVHGVATQTTGAGGALRAATTPPPAKGRKQDYRATLTVRVRSLGGLSDATKTAIRVTRAWGGYVVAANYAVPGKDGDSTLTLRIPVQHVQAAIQRFSSLGTLAAQDIAIRDVQGKLDTYTRELLSINERIAKIRARLTRSDLTAGERASLEVQLARARKAAASLRANRAALARTASFATISLTLTTRAAAAAAPHGDSRVERTLRDAASVLALELAFALYGLIVAFPLALLAALAWLAARAARRRSDDRLLGRA